VKSNVQPLHGRICELEPDRQFGRIEAYGATRERGANVSYADVERAALHILATERRPAVETVREALGLGSRATIATCLKRFWRDLGIRAQGDRAALTRLPSEIIEAVENIWQKSLALASQSAKNDQNAARERLNNARNKSSALLTPDEFTGSNIAHVG
jgi:hypothetical protein